MRRPGFTGSDGPSSTPSCIANRGKAKDCIRSGLRCRDLHLGCRKKTRVSENRHCPRPALEAKILTWIRVKGHTKSCFIIPSSFRSFRWDTEQDKRPWQHAPLAAVICRITQAVVLVVSLLEKTPVPQTRETFKLVSRRCGRNECISSWQCSTLTPETQEDQTHTPRKAGH